MNRLFFLITSIIKTRIYLGTVPWYMERGGNKPISSKESSKTDK